MYKAEKFVKSVFPTAKAHAIYDDTSFIIDGFPEGSGMRKWDTWHKTERKAWNEAARQIHRKMLKQLENA